MDINQTAHHATGGVMMLFLTAPVVHGAVDVQAHGEVGTGDGLVAQRGGEYLRLPRLAKPSIGLAGYGDEDSGIRNGHRNILGSGELCGLHCRLRRSGLCSHDNLLWLVALFSHLGECSGYGIEPYSSSLTTAIPTRNELAGRLLSVVFAVTPPEHVDGCV